MSHAYEHLTQLNRELGYVRSALALLDWDQQTGMPPAAATYRGEQAAYLSGMMHERFTSAEVGDWIASCESDNFEKGSVQDTNTRGWRRGYDRATKIPKALVERRAKATTEGHEAWVEARAKKDFSLFAPKLSELIEIERERAEHFGYEDEPYDALLEAYETGAKTKEVREVFTALQKELTPLVEELEAKTAHVDVEKIKGDYPVEQQQKFNQIVSEAFGFDFNAGRIDTSAHPFCTDLGPQDCRQTTRYDKRDFTSSLYGIMHETGHGLYTQGVIADEYGNPAGSDISLGIHESQSRLWENHVGRTRTFWEYWYPVACDCFPHLKNVSLDDLIAAINKVERSYIRVEADEVSYDLHIILRVEIETAIFSGELKVEELPGAWNKRYLELFEKEVPDVSQGCLQDIHWSMGGFGYFCTYTLGNLNAAQLFRAANKEVSGLEGELKEGEYASLLKWLNEKVHEPGQRYMPQDLMRSATGETTQSHYHLEHLRRKFASL